MAVRIQADDVDAIAGEIDCLKEAVKVARYQGDDILEFFLIQVRDKFICCFELPLDICFV